ncbi:MAG: TetR/AcrR family transcriptional regulator [Actinomycetota bacterium]|nr:TetR/AcrR family transcriptional regulator [Actinomycetota bacterium]MDD5666178.1 TetR/AcrR family transcriptional regulator [Actinomycetota bacterium]
MAKTSWWEILNTSAALFSRKGYSSTTLEDIASELGISKPTLYHYIEAKNDLLYSICDQAVSKLLNQAREVDNSTMTAREKLAELFCMHLSLFSEYGDFASVFFAEEKELPARQRARIRSLSREYEGILRAALEQAVEEGTFEEIDVPMTARIISSMCNWLPVWYRKSGPLTTDEVASLFLEFITRACAKRPGGQ